MRQIMVDELLLANDTRLLPVASLEPKESWLSVEQSEPEFGEVSTGKYF